VISKYEKPLSLYVFYRHKAFENTIQTTWRGRINDTVVHFSNKRLPFGGVGHRSVIMHTMPALMFCRIRREFVKKGKLADLSMRYAPHAYQISHNKEIIEMI
jgi:aldehyde dehydrogenase (NAD+)